MTEPIQIDFDDIEQGDHILVIRTNEALKLTLEGVADYQDEDGDWCVDSELLTYHENAKHEEEYFLVKSGNLPLDPGTLVTYPNYAGRPVYALKTYGEDEGWFTTFPDGSSALISDLYISRKEWTQI